MLLAENITIEAKYGMRFGPEKYEKYFQFIKEKLISYLTGLGFIYQNPNTVFSNFFTMTFQFGLESNIKPEPSRKLFLKKKSKNYLDCLREIKPSLPFLITIHFHFMNSDLLEIHIISKPAVYFQFTQLRKKPYLNEFELSCVIDENKEFVNEIMSAIHAEVIDKPHAKSEMMKIYLHDKLDEVGLENIRTLLENGGDILPFINEGASYMARLVVLGCWI